MINKQAASIEEAVVDIKDGSTILIGGFGLAGQPMDLINALIDRNLKNLTIVSNNAGNGEIGLALLLKSGAVSKMICSFPRQADSQIFDGLYRSGKIDLEVVPQGTIAARLQAAGSGFGAIYTPTAYGTLLAKGKETREIAGKQYVLEYPIYGDFALIKAKKSDRWGNLIFNKTARNFGPIMAAASNYTIAECNEIVELGELDPEQIITPGIFVKKVVKIV